MAYGRIVFGTDGSAAAARAGEVAAELALSSKAKLTIVGAYTDPTGWDERVASAMKAAEAAGMRPARIASETRQGAPAEVLATVAERIDAGLIVASRGVGQKYALSEVSRRLAHGTPCDLLLVSDRQRDPEHVYSRLLIATDGSVTADRAARKGYELAADVHASVDIVFVGHPATGGLITQDTVAVYGGDVETDVHLRQGDPGERILDTAREVDADLIVVGNKGLSGARGFLLGSVPEKVIEQADRDVLLCRTIVQAVTELTPGEGGIIERQGEKLAAYVNDAGDLHLMSARCTHMGCTVAWNPGEKTFDCPCHGSRYSPTGAVVNGPAGRPLPPA
jgi:nucleotide-binding universal stress UspA family protein/nitrite reductase/ring-hydroxylating ferredoxin subunit